jgi:hypothetical protein
MTCQELRSHLEDRQRAALRTDSVEVAAHIAICAGCHRIVEEQREIGTGLRLLQESVPQVPPSLDVAVLANYRRYAANMATSVRLRTRRPRISLVAALGWTAAVAAAMIVAYGELRLFFPGEDAVTSTVQPRMAESTVAPPPTAPPLASTSGSGTKTSRGVKRKLPAPASRPVEPARPAVSAANAIDAPPLGFRSLMYCDELSCGGPMEMIRVQLPSPAAGFTTVSQSSQFIYADVLVGHDGIARGIRIVP